jgi:hypothetical protein
MTESELLHQGSVVLADWYLDLPGGMPAPGAVAEFSAVLDNAGIMALESVEARVRADTLFRLDADVKILLHDSVLQVKDKLGSERSLRTTVTHAQEVVAGATPVAQMAIITFAIAVQGL